MLSYKSVILADDDMDDRDCFTAAFQEIDPYVNLFTVKSGEELLDFIQTEIADFLFLDINMFPINGIEALASIRKNPQHKKLPIIMYSSTGRPDDMQRSLELGANLFIRKPESYRELISILEKAMKLDWSNPEKVRAQFFTQDNIVFTI